MVYGRWFELVYVGVFMKQRNTTEGHYIVDLSSAEEKTI